MSEFARFMFLVAAECCRGVYEGMAYENAYLEIEDWTEANEVYARLAYDLQLSYAQCPDCGVRANPTLSNACNCTEGQ